jgi:hypothetical protein
MDLGKFKVQFGSVERNDLVDEWKIEHTIKEVINEDPEVKNLTEQLEKLIVSKIKVVSEKTGVSFVPDITIRTHHDPESDLPIRVASLKDDLLVAASQANLSYDHRMLGPVHLGLLEIEFAGGKKKIQDFLEPQWKDAFGRTSYQSLRRERGGVYTVNVNDLVFNKFIIKHDREVELGEAGKKYLADKQKQDAGNLNTATLKKVFFNLFAGGNIKNKDFYEWVLVRFDFFDKLETSDKKTKLTLTKQGRKYLDKHIVKYLLDTHSWGEISRSYNDDDWKNRVKIDHALLHASPGIGSILLSQTSSRRREYIKHLLSTPIEEVCSQSSDPWYSLPVY